MSAVLEEATDAGTTIAEYSATEKGLAELRRKYGSLVFDVSTAAGDKEARIARRSLVTLRTDLDKRRKEIKAPALARLKMIDEEARRITGEIEALEEPIDAAIKAEEQRKEDEKQAKLKAEQERRDRIAAAVEQIRRAADMTGKPSADIAARREQLAAQQITVEEFDEQAGAAEMARTDAIDRLDALFDAAVLHEAAQEQIRLQQEELNRLNAERVERERREAQERAEREAQERREREERERIAREAQEAEDARRRAEIEAEQRRLAQAREDLATERRQLEEQQRQQRERQEAAERAAQEERERQEREAEAERQRQAEEARLELQRQELEAAERRQREEAEAQARKSKIEKAAESMLAALLAWRGAEVGSVKSRPDRLAAARQMREEAIAAAE